jgi:hypothetical protein
MMHTYFRFESAVTQDYVSADGRSAIRKAADGLYLFGPVQPTTICVGPNNSGKSRLLRALASAKRLETLTLRSPTAQRAALLLLLDRIDAAIQPVAGTAEARAVEQQTQHLRQGIQAIPDDDQWMEVPPPSVDALRSAIEAATRAAAAMNATSRSQRKPDPRPARRWAPVRNEISKIVDDITVALEDLKPSVVAHPKRVYIPTLRTARRFGGDTIDHYLAKAHPSLVGDGISVFTGSSIFEELKGLVLGGAEGRRRLLEFETFVSRTCFAGRPIGVSPKGENVDTAHVEIQVGADPGYHLDQLGDGIQQVVLLAFAAFAEPNRLFLVEEPETHLHPGLQRAVIDLYRAAKCGPVVISTHSNHLLDTVLHSRHSLAVVRLRKVGPGGSEGTSFAATRVPEADMGLLADLGVSLSSVARVNAVIWVEGPSDVIYLRCLLEAAVGPESPPIREHLHYSFAMYGGSNVVHHSFGEDDGYALVRALRIGGIPIVVADTDDERKKARNERLSREVGERFHLTPGREVENLFPPRAIAAAVEAFGAGPCEALRAAARGEYRGERIGAWLRRCGVAAPVLHAEEDRLRDKVAFARRVVECVRSSGEQFDAEVLTFARAVLSQVRAANDLEALNAA